VTVVCDGLLVESEDGVGECDQGDACQALELQDDYLAYRAAHGRVIARGQAEIEKSTEARADRGRAIVPFEVRGYWFVHTVRYRSERTTGPSGPRAFSKLNSRKRCAREDAESQAASRRSSFELDSSAPWESRSMSSTTGGAVTTIVVSEQASSSPTCATKPTLRLRPGRGALRARSRRWP
jgi:hypothetical protein